MFKLVSARIISTQIKHQRITSPSGALSLPPLRLTTALHYRVIVSLYTFYKPDGKLNPFLHFQQNVTDTEHSCVHTKGFPQMC